MASLNRKQARFADCVWRLLRYAFESNQPVIISEAYRTKEQAEIYAAQGKGIKNSVHRKKLAVDLYRYKGGTISWQQEDYADLGRFWKTLNPDARWGGDFRNRDSVHFSFEHGGYS